MYRLFLFCPVCIITFLFILRFPANAATYYLSPTGNDSQNGTTETAAWATFNRAWQALYPGDTLILLDGTYTQSLNPNVRNGQPGALITIKAQNDGRVVIDGQYQRIPVWLYSFANGWVGDYFAIEGIIAKNSSSSVYQINGSHNIFRRVSGYNADPETNNHVFLFWSNDNLLEDCLAAGTGRKMVVVFSSSNANGQRNTIRRCFASYRKHDMRDWHDEWPWNENFEAYGGDYNIFENDIAYGIFANAGFSLLSNGPTDDNIGNKILGSVAYLGGNDYQGNPVHWGNIRPQPSSMFLIKSITEPYHRIGFGLWHDGYIKDNFLQDIIAYGNASIGLGAFSSLSGGMTNNIVNRATIFHNGSDPSNPTSINSTDTFIEDTSQLTITNSRIDRIKTKNYPHPLQTPITGSGARLTYRYINGVLKDGSDGTPTQLLWPWPMEDRARAELGLSVTNLIHEVTTAAGITDPVASIPDTNRPFLSLSPVTLAFGNINLGTAASQPITLKNLGTDTVTVTGVTFNDQGSPSHRFSRSAGGTCSTTFPITLTPDQNCTLMIAFTPQDYRAQTSELIIQANVVPYPLPPSTYLSGLGYSTTSSLPLPGIVEAEAYTSSGGTFELKPTLDASGSGKIANISAGAWTQYSLNVTLPGTYQITARYASTINSARSLSLQIDTNTPVILPLTSTTSDWETFTNSTPQNLTLSTGNHTLKVTLITGDYDLNYFSFNLPGSPTVTPGLTAPPPTIGDLDGDTDVDYLDLIKLITSFNTSGPGNFNLTGLVDIFDFNRLLSNL